MASDVTSEVTMKLHPKGFKAFPPELRHQIFESYYANSRKASPSSCPLLQALRGHDKDLYEEAKVDFYSSATIVTHGEWRKPECYSEPYFHCPPFSSQFQVKLHKFESSVPIKEMRMARNLEIAYKISELDDRVTQFANFLLRPHEDISFRHFQPFTHVKHLTLRLYSTIPNDCQLNVQFTGQILVRPLLEKFQKLTKLSIILYDGLGGRRSPLISPLILTRGFTLPMLTGNYWVVRSPDRSVTLFDMTVVDYINGGLGVRSKLGTVRTSMAGRDEVDFPFITLTYGEDRHHEVVWFWEAEARETLVWNEENAQKVWDVETRGLPVDLIRYY